jgi:tetratricopeptide (TPR) repeat protein
MNDLLAALDRDPRRVGTRWLALAAAAFVVVASYAGFRAGRQGAGGACGRSAERFAGVWDQGRKTALAERFRSSGLAYAADTWHRVELSIDRYVAAWIEAHDDACRATHVRHEQSAELLDLRMACLAERYDQIEALLQTYAEATPSVVKDAISLAHGLDSIDACADTDQVRARIHLPKDPLARARVGELQGDLERARAMLEAIDREGAKELATATLEEIRTLGFTALEAEALGLIAEIDDRSGDWKAGEDGYYEAIRAAEAASHEQLKAHLWIRLGASLGSRGKFDEGARCLDLAEAALGRAGGDPELQTALFKTRGVIFAERGDYEAAFENTKRAVDLYRDNVNADSLLVAHLYNNLGVIRSRQGRRREGLRWMRESTDRKRELLGPDHPIVGAALVNLGAIATDNLELDTSRRTLAEARRIYDLSLAPDDPHIGTLLVNEGALAEAEGRYEDADRKLSRAMEILDKALPADHPSVAQVIYGLGMTKLQLGQHSEAVQRLEAALALREKLWGEGDLDVAVVLAPLARAVHGTGDRVRAVELVARSEAIIERRHDDPFGVADAQFQLARALWEIDIDRDRAVGLAREALRSMEAMEDAPLRRMRELSEWLAERSG